MRKHLLLFIILCFLLISCKDVSYKVNIIPFPKKIELNKRHFTLNNKTKINISNDSDSLRLIANLCAEQLNSLTNISPDIISGDIDNNVISFNLIDNKNMGKEDYQINIDRHCIKLKAVSTKGLFYAFQSLRQLLPNNKIEQRSKWKIPGVYIEDSPRFPWRGMTLDVARHFMPKDIVKRYIDIMSFYKMNILHIHLCDDQGWRIEIKQYPILTEKSAWRIDHNGSIYGGFYTQNDIKELIEYAAQRNVEIIPEIEMPGHATALLSAFPEISCKGQEIAVSNSWGIHDNTICPGKDTSYTILQNILSEIIELFPSKYIHLGGNETKYNYWNQCLACKNLCTKKRLNSSNRLQHYFFSKMVDFLDKHNKTMIGWEEIIRGGLPKNSVVQVWKNDRIINSATFMQHPVIVSLNQNSFFHQNVYQTPLHTVYENPIIPEGLKKDREKYILGGECCLWTEYITPKTIDTFAFPRLIAYSEILWSQKSDKDFVSFYRRLVDHRDYKNFYNIQFGDEAKPISLKADFDAERKKCFISMSAAHKDISIHYCYSDKTPYYYSNIYDKPLVFSNSGKLTALAFVGNLPYGEALHWQHINHSGLGIEPLLQYEYAPKYNAGGVLGLTDGIKGSLNYLDGNWQGFKSKNLIAIIDLKKTQTINSISISFLHNPNVWIFAPREVSFYTSDTGIDFQQHACLSANTPEQLNRIVIEEFSKSFTNLKARYIKVTAKNLKKCPDWHPSGGNHAWLFADEIVIR